MTDEPGALPEIDPSLAEFVRAYEAETARDGAQVEAALQQATAKIGSTAAGAAGLSVSAKVGVTAVVLGAVAVVAVAAWPSPEAGPAARVDAPTIVPERAGVEDAPAPEPAPAPTPAPPEPEPPSTDAPPPASADAPAKARPKAPAVGAKNRPKPAPPAGDPPPTSKTSLKAELELLRKARAALRSGKAQRALDLVEQHRHDYPGSSLAEERDATEVSALCAMGRTEQARRAAATTNRRFNGCP